MHFGSISLNLARNGQNFNAGVLLKDAKIKFNLLGIWKILCLQTSGLFLGQKWTKSAERIWVYSPLPPTKVGSEQ